MSYKINDITFSELGVIRATLSLPHLDVGRLNLTLDRAVDLTAMGLAHGASVVLTRDATVIFRGTVNAPGVSGEVESLTVVDFWFDLESLTFINTEQDMTELGWSSARQMAQWFGASGEDEDDAAMSAAERLQVIADYADDAGIEFQLGSSVEAMTFNYSPEPPRNNPATTDVIRQLMETLPDWCLWVDYSTTPPTLEATRRLPAEDAGIVTLVTGQPPLSDFTLRLRRDLAVDGVVIKWERNGSISYETYPPEASPDQPRVLLFSRRWHWAHDEGYAQAWYGALNDIIAEGRISLVGVECDHSWHCGMTINITGSRSEFATMRGMVQDVTHDLMSGTTTLVLGLPQYLGQRYLRDIEHGESDDDEDDAGSDGPDPLPGPEGPLSGYCVRVDEDVVFRVAPGTVNMGDPDGEVVPLWESSSTPLDASSPPGAVVGPEAAFVYYLYVEFSPEVEEFYMLDSEGDPVVEYRPLTSCTIEEARIVFGKDSPAARAPLVNPTTGDVEETGRVYFRLGTFSWPPGDDVPTIMVERSGSLQLLFVPPGKVFIVP